MIFFMACASNPYEKLNEDLGLDRYLGDFEPSSSEELANGDISYTFDDGTDGPTCLRGTPFRTFIRDNGSDDLMIFLQGGGACWSDFCIAREEAETEIPYYDVLRTDLPENPMKDWNILFVSYCDGSIYAGDANIDEDGDGEVDRYHHGLQNLSAALDIGQSHFPRPKRLMIAGSSGGGYGSTTLSMLIRSVYKKQELLVFQDSGIGMGMDADASFLNDLVAEFNAPHLNPEEGILDSGHLTDVIKWQLEQDPGLKIAAFSSYEDFVISKVFLQVNPPELYKEWVVEQTDKLSSSYPERYKTFLIAGDSHTTLLGDPSGALGLENSNSTAEEVIVKLTDTVAQTDGETVLMTDWLSAFADQTTSWNSVVEDPDTQVEGVDNGTLD